MKTKSLACSIVLVSVTVAAVIVGVVSDSAASAAGTASTQAGSLVEDFAYPGADQILKDHQLEVTKGDGHILFVTSHKYGDGQCAVGEVQVEKALTVDPYGVYYCFRTVGTQGTLTLRVPTTFGVRGGDKPLQATAELASGKSQTYDIPANQSVAIDPGSGSTTPQSILVLLTFGPQ